MLSQENILYYIAGYVLSRVKRLMRLVMSASLFYYGVKDRTAKLLHCIERLHRRELVLVLQ